MRYTIYGKNIQVSQNVKELLKKKFSKFDRYFKEDPIAYVNLSTEKYRNVVEVTIPLKKGVLRAEVKDKDLQTAVEKAVEKLERQFRRHKTKLKKYRDDFNQDNLELIEEIDEEPGKVVRTKKFAFKPMDVEEATLQMELLGHTFYVFLNSDTELVNVVYKRKDGDYGLIEPDV